MDKKDREFASLARGNCGTIGYHISNECLSHAENHDANRLDFRFKIPQNVTSFILYNVF